MKPPKRTLELTFLLSIVCCFLAPLCKAQCNSDVFYTCVIPKLNMSAGGMAKLEAAVAQAHFTSYYIGKLIVPNPPSGAFLQRICSLAEAIGFDVYYEPVLHLLEGTSLHSIWLDTAPNLRAFVVAGLNDHLKELSINQSLLERIPATIGKLRNLSHLQITHTRLEVLSLDALATNRELVHVELTSDFIVRVLPLTNSRVDMAIQEMDLSDNLIEYLDMTMWAPLKALRVLILENNRLVSLHATQPVEMIHLTALYLDSNRLKAVDLRQLFSPQLQTITLNHNELTEVPSAWGTKASLSQISMHSNSITSFNFDAVRTLTQLEIIDVHCNRIHSVLVGHPTVRLPNLREIHLQNNTLSRLDLNGTDFTQLSYVGLARNRFTTVPRVFGRYPNLNLALEENPITCASLKAYRNQLETYTLVITYAVGQDRCPEAYISYGGFNYCCVL